MSTNSSGNKQQKGSTMSNVTTISRAIECGSCQYFDIAKRSMEYDAENEPVEGDRIANGWCRINPPDSKTGWPLVRTDDWCGCHESTDG